MAPEKNVNKENDKYATEEFHDNGKKKGNLVSKQGNQDQKFTKNDKNMGYNTKGDKEMQRNYNDSSKNRDI